MMVMMKKKGVESPPHFPGQVSTFRDRRLPEMAIPAGYSALIAAYGLKIPLPRKLFATGEHHRLVEDDSWKIMSPRHAPQATIEGHLTFALKYEGLDLAVLKRICQAAGPAPIESIVRQSPTGSYARRLWFLYEWMTGEQLDLPDAVGGRYVLIVNPALQYDAARDSGDNKGENVTRQRVKNNLPGTPAFCPLVFRTAALERYAARNLSQRAQEIAAKVPRDILARTAAFLLLKDSKASYAIEGERPPHDRIQRWGQAIGEAGRRPLDQEELLRLQRIVIGDDRFVRLGFRDDDGFVGEHDRETKVPLPVHISARPEDIPSLIDGMLEFDRIAARLMDPVVAAAILTFGFVYTHPFEDGNGRLHRYLIHHVLAEQGFNPPGVVFPISAAILGRIQEYDEVLRSYSERLLPLIEWEQTAQFNVRVVNDTADFYRYFDATPHAEFLYGCVEQTIEVDLPREANFLRRYDAFRGEVQMVVDMPERMVDLLFRFLSQNGGRLSERARRKEFRLLSQEEAGRIEEAFARCFGGGVGS